MGCTQSNDANSVTPVGRRVKQDAASTLPQEDTQAQEIAKLVQEKQDMLKELEKKESQHQADITKHTQMMEKLKKAEAAQTPTINMLDIPIT